MRREARYLCLGCGARHVYARRGPVEDGCPVCRHLYLEWLNTGDLLR